MFTAHYFSFTCWQCVECCVLGLVMKEAAAAAAVDDDDDDDDKKLHLKSSSLSSPLSLGASWSAVSNATTSNTATAAARDVTRRQPAATDEAKHQRTPSVDSSLLTSTVRPRSH